MSSISKIYKYLTDLSNFHPFEIVDNVNETHNIKRVRKLYLDNLGGGGKLVNENKPISSCSIKHFHLAAKQICAYIHKLQVIQFSRYRGPGAVVKVAWKIGDRRFVPAHSQRFSFVWSLLDREEACSASNRQVSNFELYICQQSVPSHSSHHPQDVFLFQFSLYVYKCA